MRPSYNARLAARNALKVGDSVTLTRPIEGRYSGYGGLPNFEAPAGTVATIRHLSVVPVHGRGLFHVCDVDGWPDGVCVYAGDFTINA